MLEAVRERVSRWMGREAPAVPPPDALIFADHEEIRDIARQMARTKVELDRSVLALRAWGDPKQSETALIRAEAFRLDDKRIAEDETDEIAWAHAYRLLYFARPGNGAMMVRLVK